jgi:hypothetical protein
MSVERNIARPISNEPDPRQVRIDDICDLVNDDPELTEAVNLLVRGTEYAETIAFETLVWENFTDRVKYLISRAKTNLERA